MKIISYDEMLTVPVGTVFYRMFGHGGCMDALDGPYRKDNISAIDIFQFHVGPQFIDKGFHRRFNPERDYEQFSISNMGEREGLFNHEAKYLVLDEADVALMVKLLTCKLEEAGDEIEERFIQIPPEVLDAAGR